MPQTQVVLCEPERTAIDTYGGTLKNIPATEGERALRATRGS